MPANKDLKRLIRARMARTGEGYSTARARVLAAGSGRSPVMRFESSTAGGPQITAVDVPDDHLPVLHGLGFSDDLVWRIPDAAPGGEAVIRNWSRNGLRYVDQVVGVAVSDWESALDWFAGLADGLGIDWFLFGTAGLAIRGVDRRPDNVNVGTDEAGAERLAANLTDEVMIPIVATDGWEVSTHSGNLFRGAPVGVIAGILDRDWPTPWDSDGRRELEPVSWRGHTIRVTSLDRELAYARRMARFGLARAIVRHRARQGGGRT